MKEVSCKGIEDVLRDTVDLERVSQDPTYRNEVMEGLCRWEAFLSLRGDISPRTPDSLVTSIIQDQRIALERAVRMKSSPMVEMTARNNHRSLGSDTDANISSRGNNWFCPLTMPRSLSERLTSNPRQHSRLAQL